MLRGRGAPSCFVSHNIDAVQRLCNRLSFSKTGERTSLTAYRMHCPTTSTGMRSQKSPSYRDATYVPTAELRSVDVDPLTGTLVLGLRPGSEDPRDYSVVLHDEKQNPLFATHLTDLGAPVTSAAEFSVAIPLPRAHLRSGRYFSSVIHVVLAWTVVFLRCRQPLPPLRSRPS